MLGPDSHGIYRRHRARQIKQQATRFRRVKKTGEPFFVENDGSLATCIPAEAIGDALEWANDGHGHYSVLTTMMHPGGRFYWPTRAKDAVEYCRLYIVRQRIRPGIQKVTSMKPTSVYPMELVGMDFIGPIHPEASDGSKYILVAVDYATKFIFLKCTSEATAEVVADIWLRDCGPLFGFPDSTFADNGSHFANSYLREILRKEGSTMRFGPVSCPQTTRQSENAVKLVKHELKTWAAANEILSEQQHKAWYLEIPRINRVVNSRYHLGLETSPSIVMLGWNTLDGPCKYTHPGFEATEDERPDIQAEAMNVFAER